MSNQNSPTITYRDPLDYFTDREEILTLFEQVLSSTEPSQFRLLGVKGNSGTGKTFLISYLIKYVCPKLKWQAADINFALSIRDFRPILTALEDGLKRCVSQQDLKEYRLKRDEYIKRFDEYQASFTVHQSIIAENQSAIFNINQNVEVNAGFRERELHLRFELSRALIEMAEKTSQPLCIFIDGYERLIETDQELDSWIWEKLLLDLVKASPQPLLVVTCGWERPSNSTIKPFSHFVDLRDFNIIQVRSYLEKMEVITNSVDLVEREELIKIFYDVSKGHPLVLGLAATYFNELDTNERSSKFMKTNRPLVDDRAQVGFLEERLLSRLSEPYRTILERGPILRFFNQKILQALMNVSGLGQELGALDDQAYDRLLKYPFVNRESTVRLSDESLVIQPTFHELVRRVRLEALRYHHPETKEKLHRKAAEYYLQILQADSEQETAKVNLNLKDTSSEGTSRTSFIVWASDIPDQKFKVLLEFLYHELQIKDDQVKAFNYWDSVTDFLMGRWRREHVRLLLELIPQLKEEGELLFNNKQEPYGMYLFWYAKFLMQEFRWEEALATLEEAAMIFEQVKSLEGDAKCFFNIGQIYQKQGKWEDALRYFEKSLELCKQIDNKAFIATNLNDIGLNYYEQGQWELALNYLEEALSIRKQIDIPRDIAQSFLNIGFIYRKQGKLEQAMRSYEQALALYVKDGYPARIALTLNNIGEIYRYQGNLEQALHNHTLALTLREKVGDISQIAQSLNNIGEVYRMQGKLEQALDYYKRSLALKEQVGNPVATALSQHNIALIYHQQGEYDEAIKWYSKALRLYEELGRGYATDVADELEGLAACYAHIGQVELGRSFYNTAMLIRLGMNR